MKANKLDTLYRLMDRAEKERDYESVSALWWAIFALERGGIEKLK